MLLYNYFKKNENARKDNKDEKGNKYIEFNIQKDFSNNECIICLDNMSINEKIIMIDCGHKYHKTCLLDWFQKKKICPVCDFIV